MLLTVMPSRLTSVATPRVKEFKAPLTIVYTLDAVSRPEPRIAEVEELVELGELAPESIHTPGIFVNAIFQGTNYEKKIEKRTVRKRP